MANYGVATQGMILFTKCLRYIHICGILHYSAATRNILANLFLLSQQNISPDDVGGSNGQGASHLYINSMIQRYKLFF